LAPGRARSAPAEVNRGPPCDFPASDSER
jgi:hypothetical protein